jgi:hypothetical protein
MYLAGEWPSASIGLIITMIVAMTLVTALLGYVAWVVLRAERGRAAAEALAHEEGLTNPSSTALGNGGGTRAAGGGDLLSASRPLAVDEARQPEQLMAPQVATQARSISGHLQHGTERAERF